MSAWFSANLINIALAAAVALVVGLVIFVMVRDRRAGKSPCGCSCGGGCSSCGGCSACHRAKNTAKAGR